MVEHTTTSPSAKIQLMSARGSGKPHKTPRAEPSTAGFDVNSSRAWRS
jgi:hypothetical protein